MLPFTEGAFDLIFSNLDLHWTNDFPGSLLQIRRALKPNGLFLAAIFGGETLRELCDVLMNAEAKLSDGASPRISPSAELRDAGGLLQRARFALPVADSDEIVVTYDNLFRLAADLRGMAEGNALHELLRLQTGRQVFLHASQLHAERYPAEDGRIRATFQIVYLHGWTPHESQPKAMRPGSATARLTDTLGAALPDDS